MGGVQGAASSSGSKSVLLLPSEEDEEQKEAERPKVAWPVIVPSFRPGWRKKGLDEGKDSVEGVQSDVGE